jgi:hypothetical protein
MDLKVTGPARRFETRSSEEHRTFARAPFARDDVDEVLGPETGKQAKKNLRIKHEQGIEHCHNRQRASSHVQTG